MENLNEIAGYAPIIIVVLMFFVQYRIFVTPEQLEKKHREILEDISKNYVQYPAYKTFKGQVISELEDVKKGVNDIKDFLIRGEKNK